VPLVSKLNIVLVLVALLAGGCSKYGVGRSDGGDPDGSVDAGGDGECVVRPPLPVGLQIGEGDFPTGYGEVAGTAWVIYKGYPQERWTSEVWLFFPEYGHREMVFSELPFDYGIPVDVGDEVWARVTVDTPWWVNQYAQIQLPSGAVIYDQIDSDFWMENPAARCPPEEGFCGMVIHPAVKAWNTTLEQGEWNVIAVDLVASKVFMGSLYYNLTMECYDVPMGWIQSAMINHRLRSQCRCRDDYDCTSAEVCDTIAQRCVENRCAVVDCAPDYFCDPFTGECVELPAELCWDDGDCGEMQVCNPKTGICKDDFCQIVDCAPCSALIGECYQCLHDCDCGLEICNRQSRSCEPGCVESKLGLTRENPEAYELYYVCVRGDLPDPAELMNKYEPSMTCGNTSPPSTCDPATETACLAELAYEPNSRRISWEKWVSICAISRNPVVSRIAGGHYLP
jgi:hypothetical protein